MKTSRIGISGIAAGMGTVLILAGIGIVTAQDRRPPPPPPPPPRQDDDRPPAEPRPERPRQERSREPRPTSRPAPLAPGETRVPVTFAGGHDTDPRDGGRPVKLIAAALGVPEDVFRETFTHVRPAGEGRGPTGEEARRNKAALLRGLAKYGVTNDRLDEVSNHYRYRPGRGELWTHRPAAAYASVIDGVVTGLIVTDGGAGYSTPPTITVDGHPKLPAKAVLAFTTDLDTNGAVESITTQSPTTRPR
jgi:hypothetical protein